MNTATGILFKEKPCVSCGAVYRPTGKNQKFCLTCRDKEYSIKDRQYELKRKGPPREKGPSLEEKRKFFRDLLDELKNVPCCDCGLTFHPVAMDFDHVRGEKKFDVGLARQGRHLLAAVMEEVEKCEVVCSNCHRVRTFTRSTQ